MSSSIVNDNGNIEFFSNITNNILNFHNSIRWVGIINQNGMTIKEQFREGLKHLLTIQETHEFAKNTIIRHKTRLKLEPKIGKLTYLFRRYEKLSRFIIPINENYYLLFTMDFKENNFDQIITEKIIPLVKEEKDKFF